MLCKAVISTLTGVDSERRGPGWPRSALAAAKALLAVRHWRTPARCWAHLRRQLPCCVPRGSGCSLQALWAGELKSCCVLLPWSSFDSAFDSSVPHVVLHCSQACALYWHCPTASCWQARAGLCKAACWWRP